MVSNGVLRNNRRRKTCAKNNYLLFLLLNVKRIFLHQISRVS